MATLTNLDALRNVNLDDLIRRVHHEHEDIVIEDQTLPVAAIIDINKYQALTDTLQQAQGPVVTRDGEPRVQGSDITIREIAERHRMGDSIDDLRHRFSMLNPGQLYAALAYYYAHSDEIDRLIAQRRAERAAIQAGTGA